MSYVGSRVQGLSCQFMLMVVQRNLSQGRTCGGSMRTSETAHVGGFVLPMKDCFECIWLNGQDRLRLFYMVSPSYKPLYFYLYYRIYIQTRSNRLLHCKVWLKGHARKQPAL